MVEEIGGKNVVWCGLTQMNGSYPTVWAARLDLQMREKSRAEWLCFMVLQAPHALTAFPASNTCTEWFNLPAPTTPHISGYSSRANPLLVCGPPRQDPNKSASGRRQRYLCHFFLWEVVERSCSCGVCVVQKSRWQNETRMQYLKCTEGTFQRRSS